MSPVWCTGSFLFRRHLPGSLVLTTPAFRPDEERSQHRVMVIAPFQGIVYGSVDLIFASFVSLREVIKVRAQEVQSNKAQFAGVASAFGI
jgi:hypothetical protein